MPSSEALAAMLPRLLGAALALGATAAAPLPPPHNRTARAERVRVVVRAAELRGGRGAAWPPAALFPSWHPLSLANPTVLPIVFACNLLKAPTHAPPG